MGRASENIKNKTESKEQAVFLRKKVSLLQTVSFLIGTIIGSGIFISPKGILINSGNVGTSLVIWLACGILSMLGALSYAELGTSIKKSGGHYIYLLETLGPLPAFVRLWCEIIVIRPAITAVVGLSFGRYIVEPFFAPCQAPALAVKLLTAAGVSLVVFVNSWSVNWTARIQMVLTIFKLAALGLIIVPGMVALAQGRYENFQNAFDSSKITLDRIPLAFYSGMFAYSGWFYMNFVAEEIINPERNIPLAIISSLIIVTILYLLVNVAYYTVLTADEVLASGAVAVTFGDRTLKGFSSVIQILVALSCLGAITGALFAVSRVFFVASRENQWPTLFSMIHIRHHTPLPAVLLMYPLVILMIFFGDLYGLLNLNSFPRWLFMGLVTFGLIRHRYKQPDLHRPFKVPIIIPGIFTAMCMFIVVTSLYSDPINTGIGCALTLSGVPVYYLVVCRRQGPAWCRKTLYHFTVKLQILMEVVQQEIVTY
ncbi:cystine/glutamate transporter-like [Carcharodon carcharias]|uniref:cystine/glutamate transporter-like n=1 Tax=Carcharodon carcharias TaxID=13397 RepID=UPI001B7DDDD9|nr:cystine/glutamate transporter-like [Carcharodon carcharias]